MTLAKRCSEAVSWQWAAGLLAAFALVWPVGPAQARDADGSRLGARAMEVGASVEDELAPGDDKADWRYFKAEKARSYTVELDHEPTDATVHLKLTRATGETVDETTTEKGTARVASSLEPGLYYVEVAAETAVTYTLSVK